MCRLVRFRVNSSLCERSLDDISDWRVGRIRYSAGICEVSVQNAKHSILHPKHMITILEQPRAPKGFPVVSDIVPDAEGAVSTRDEPLKRLVWIKGNRWWRLSCSECQRPSIQLLGMLHKFLESHSCPLIHGTKYSNS